MNDRSQQKYYVNRIGKPLLIFGVVRQGRIEGPSVISGLYLAGNFGAVRITVAKDQFPGSEPARIQVGKISARSAVRSSVGLLILDQHPLHVKPHATCHQNRQQQTEFGSIQQHWKIRIRSHVTTYPASVLVRLRILVYSLDRDRVPEGKASPVNAISAGSRSPSLNKIGRANGEGPSLFIAWSL
jgi:hypothetical protein